MTRLRLVTIKASHYCEKARWGLDRLGLEYDEVCHPPVFQVLASRLAGGRGTVPVLVTGEGVLGDSTDILEWLDRRAPEAARLYPEPGRAEVAALEERFDEVLGPHVRRWAYFHLLPQRETVVPLAAAGVRSRAERLGLRLGYRPLRALMRRAMNITAEATARSVGKMDEVWAEVAARLADGRRWLVGERFGAADLTFAALAGPAVCPPEYGGPLPALHELPPAMREEVERRRASPPGEFVLRVYREERARRVG